MEQERERCRRKIRACEMAWQLVTEADPETEKQANIV